jgi:hypothetical protein
MHDRAIRPYKQSLLMTLYKRGKIIPLLFCWNYVNLELTTAVADSTFLNEIDPAVR